MTRNILDWICSARRYLASACAGALACTTLPATAMSATGEVYFGVNVTVNNACFIFVTQDGSLGTNVDATQMSSMLPGGTS